MTGASAGTFESPNARRRPWLRLTVAMSLALGVTLLLRSEWTTGVRGLLLRTATLALGWREDGQPREAVVRTPLKELAARLDPARFAQVHRSVVVNLGAISHVRRHDNETAAIHLKGRGETLPVSRAYLHLFRQM